jgi:hypothetical protein
LYCGQVGVETVVAIVNHFEEFSNVTFGQVVDSFMFGMLANAIEFRNIYVQVQAYSSQNNTLGIAQELIQFVTDIITFSNLYYNDPAAQQYLVATPNT